MAQFMRMQDCREPRRREAEKNHAEGKYESESKTIEEATKGRALNYDRQLKRRIYWEKKVTRLAEARET